MFEILVTFFFQDLFCLLEAAFRIRIRIHPVPLHLSFGSTRIHPDPLHLAGSGSGSGKRNRSGSGSGSEARIKVDPDPAKCSGSGWIRIRIRNAVYMSSKLYITNDVIS